MASAPLNMSPLFAAGHVIATTTVDRFLMDAELSMIAVDFGWSKSEDGFVE